ncbi:hypothetical protein ACHAWF_001940 [Thalassiosira exigua]
MGRFSAALAFNLSFICGISSFGAAFVSPASRSNLGVNAAFIASIDLRQPPGNKLRNIIGYLPTNEQKTCMGSRGDDGSEEEVADGTADENDTADDDRIEPPDAKSLTGKKEPSMTAKVTNAIFLVFSYCIQFLGALFFLGLILNFLGYAYTFDLDGGLVIDTIPKMRNEVQFEREVEREERAALMESASSQDIISPSFQEDGAASRDL